MREKLKELQALNPHVPLYTVDDEAFRPYGKVLTGYNFEEVLKLMEKSPMPQEGNTYVTSVEELEKTSVKQTLQELMYGGMDIQIGYCNGRNSNLNGLEYHKGSEINVAVTDLVLLLGKVQDIRENSYSTEHIQGFVIPRGTAVELYATTLHFAPCKVSDEGFKCVVILPKGTNEPLTGRPKQVTAEDRLLFMRNKWLLAHPERTPLLERGAHPGIIGANIAINYESVRERE